MTAYTAGDSLQVIERVHGVAAGPTAGERIELAHRRERPIDPAALRTLFAHVGWDRPADQASLAAVLAAGQAVGAWDGAELVGFVRALSDGHHVAYVEDVMVHERCRGRGLGSALMARLMGELESVAVVNLFCASDAAPFYEGLGFRPTTGVLLQRKLSDPDARS